MVSIASVRRARASRISLTFRFLHLNSRRAKNSQRLGHAPDLIGAARRKRGFEVTLGQLQHPIAQRSEASDNVTPDVEPSDQYRTDQAKCDGRSQSDPAKLLYRLRACGCRQNALLRSRDKHVHGMAQLSRNVEFSAVRRRPS